MLDNLYRLTPIFSCNYLFSIKLNLFPARYNILFFSLKDRFKEKNQKIISHSKNQYHIMKKTEVYISNSYD